MPIWTPVHHRRNALLIRSNRWWLLLKIKSPVSVIRCPDLQLSAQTCDFAQIGAETDCRGKSYSASQMIRHPNARFPKSLLPCCASRTSRSVIKSFFFSFPFKAKFNLGHEKLLISKYKDIQRSPFRKSAWSSYINQSKQDDSWTPKHWLNANSKLNDLVSRRAQLEETGRVSSKQKSIFWPENQSGPLSWPHVTSLVGTSHITFITCSHFLSCHLTRFIRPPTQPVNFIISSAQMRPCTCASSYQEKNQKKQNTFMFQPYGSLSTVCVCMWVI